MGLMGTLCGPGLKKPPTRLETTANGYREPGHTGEYCACRVFKGLCQVPDMFPRLFPEHEIKQDKDTKSNFRVQKSNIRFYPYDPCLLEGFIGVDILTVSLHGLV